MGDKRQEQIRSYCFVGLLLFLVAFCWYTVVAQSKSLEKAAIKTYQEAQLEVVKNAARAATLFIESEIKRDVSVGKIEQRVLKEIVTPIRIGKVGDAWIYSPDYVVFDKSADFPSKYIGKNMAQIFEMQKEKGARHYEDMSADVMHGRKGTGWYIWEPDKALDSAPWWEYLTRDSGREIAAWSPVKVFPGTPKELTWVIGMSAMLTEIMRINGAYAQVQGSILTVSSITALVLIMLLLLRRAKVQVNELRQEVNKLRIEIDEAKRQKHVSEIVETEQFQNLAARAKEMRARRKKVS